MTNQCLTSIEERAAAEGGREQGCGGRYAPKPDQNVTFSLAKRVHLIENPGDSNGSGMRGTEATKCSCSNLYDSCSTLNRLRFV